LLLAAFIAALHYLALPLGLGAVFARGLRLRELSRSLGDGETLARLFRADNFWGLAALLWIATGLVRAFGGLEKSSTFYLRNGFFLVKMGLFVAVLGLEIFPMITFIRWRIARARGNKPTADAPYSVLVRLNDLEVALVVLIPFAASLMSRGVWLY
jgi:putative membrane protein